MPQAVFVGIGLSLESALGAFLITNSAILSTATYLLGGLALSASKQRSAKRKAREQFNAQQVDRLVNISTTTGPREGVLGRVRKGGNVFFKGSTGNNKTTFVMLLALAGHEIDAVETVYLNDAPVTLDGSGNVLDGPYGMTNVLSGTAYSGATGIVTLDHPPVEGSVTAHTGTTAGPEGDIAPASVSVVGSVVTTTPNAFIQYQYTSATFHANIRAVLGSASQAADAEVMALFPSVWTAAHRARAVAYLVCRFEYSETAFPTGLPTVTAVVRGAKCYDPRTGLIVWTDNPALHMRHVYAHPSFGKATPSAAEDARITAAANICDTSTGYVVNGVTETRALYRSGLVVPFGTAAKDVLEDLAQAMAGSWAHAGGELYLKAGAYSASVMSLTDADLAVVERQGATVSQRRMNIAPHRERVNKFNTVNVRIWDAAQDYKQVPLVPLVGEALVARDGAALPQEVSYAAIGYAPQALHVAGIMMRDARDPMTIVMPFKLRAYPVELFDTVDLTLERFGWVAKLFMVLWREWTGEGKLQLTLKETAAAIYTRDAAFTVRGYAANTNLPNPWYVAPVGELTITSGTAELLEQADTTVVSRMRVTWPAINDASVTQGGTVEVQYRSVLTDGAWASVQVSGGETNVLVADVQDNAVYVVRARARNRLAVGQWGAQKTHKVLGKTENPSEVTGVATTQELAVWNHVPDIDVARGGGYEVRAVPGDTAEFSLGVPVHKGLVPFSPFRYETRLVGVQTIMVAAVDSTGHYGLAGSATLDFGNIDELNVAQAYDYAAAGFPGEITNATVSGATLLADADPAVDFWSTSTGADFWHKDGAADFWGGSAYLALQYVATFVPDYSDGQAILDTTLVGSRATIEWRYDGGLLGDFWARGGSDFWSGSDFWGTTAEWQPYIGAIKTTAGVGIQWRITIEAGPIRGQISAIAVRLQMPPVTQLFSGITIDAAGTRLPPATGSPPVQWIEVEEVYFTPFDDGSGAAYGRVVDFDPVLGPLVQMLNAAGTPVTATGQTARPSGF